MVTLGRAAASGPHHWLKTLTQHFYMRLGMEHFYQEIIKLLSFNATTLYQKVGGVAGGVSSRSV